MTTKLRNPILPWSPFTPGQPAFWTDISNMSQSNLSNITSATDRSGNGKSFATAAANFPIFRVNNWYRRAVADMTAGTQQALTTGGASASVTPYTFLIVASSKQDGANPITIIGSHGSGGLVIRINTSNQLELVQSFVTVLATSSGTVPVDNKFHSIVAQYKQAGTNTYAFYIDGVAAGTGTVSTALTAGQTFEFGSDQGVGGGALYWGGVGEVIGYNLYLTPVWLAGWEQYAKTKWNTNFATAQTADGFVDMFGQTVGAQISADIVALGTLGQNQWTLDNATSAFMVAANQVNRPTAVTCAGITSAAGTNDKALAFLHTSQSQGILTTALDTGKTSVVISGWITLGPAVGGSILVDYMGLNGNNGHYASVQLNTGGGGSAYVGDPGTYGLELETNPGGVTTHTVAGGGGTGNSGTLTLSSGTTYWCTLQVVYGTGIATLKVYDTSSSLLGTVTSLTIGVGTDTSGQADFGVGAHATTFAGKTSYLQGIIIDSTNASYPRLP